MVQAATTSPGSTATLDDLLLQHELEQFLYYEASLLDARRFHEWLTLLADDVEYWMPVRTTRMRGDEEYEFARPGESAFFDETKALLEERVRKLDTGVSWAEDPPSRTRHFVSNVRIVERPSPTEVRLDVAFFVYRSRLAQDEDMWVGRREDTLRREGASWKIARRHLFLDQVSLRSKNLSIFF